MELEVVGLGDSARWVLSQPRIRIGRGAQCEIALAGARYAAVAAEHVTLDVASGAVKLTALAAPVFLNENPAGEGFVVRSGDVLRLGIAGPEFRVRINEQAVPQPSHEATRVMQVDPSVNRAATQVMAAPGAHEATRVMQVEPQATHAATQVISAPGSTTAATAPMQPPPAAASPGRFGYAADAAPRTPLATPVPAPPRTPPMAVPPRPDFSASAAPAHEAQPPAAAQPIAARAGEEEEDMEMLESKLKGLRLLLIVNLVVVVALLAFIFHLNQELTLTRQEVADLRAQAQSAVAQFTPSLDSRLSVFEKRMDSVDGKLKAAQDQMVSSVDAKMKSTEDRLVERMNAEIPAMLDKYVNKKLTEVKH